MSKLGFSPVQPICHSDDTGKADTLPRFEYLVSLLCEEHHKCLQCAHSQLSTKAVDIEKRPLLEEVPNSHPIDISKKAHDGSSNKPSFNAQHVQLPTLPEEVVMEDSAKESEINGMITSGTFCLHKAWEEQDCQSRRATFAVDHNISDSIEESNTDAVKKDSRMCMLHPSSKRRLGWDICCLLAITYDLIVVPLQFFDLGESTIVIVGSWTTRCVWTIDMPVSCFVGFFRKGTLYMSLHQSTLNYARSWFPFDLTLVFADWFFEFFRSPNRKALQNLARWARIARIFRLLRLLKMQRLLVTLEERIHSESLATQFHCCKLMLAMICLIHILGCCWFGVGMLGYHDGVKNWIGESEILDKSLIFQYSYSVNWALSRLVLNTHDPLNLMECLYIIAMLFLGIVAFSSFVGGFTSAFEQLREMRRDESRQFWLLRRYMGDHHISKKPTSRVLRYCEYAYSMQRARKQQSDVMLLQMLSDKLREDLETEIHTPQLIPHPLLDKMQQHYLSWSKICANTLSIQYFAAKDAIFTRSVAAPGMYMIFDGQGSHQHIGVRNIRTITPLNCKDWLCEAALWTKWVTIGHAKAVKNCRVVVIHSDAFQQVISSATPPEWLMLHFYAIAFMTKINKLDDTSLSDLMWDLMDAGDIRSSFGKSNAFDRPSEKVSGKHSISWLRRLSS